MIIRCAAMTFATALMLVAGNSRAEERVGDARINQAVVSRLLERRGIHSEVLAHVDLTKPFTAKSQWTLVVGKQPDQESATRDGAGGPEGVVFACFVKNGQADCSEEMFDVKFRQKKITFDFGGSPFFQLLPARSCMRAGEKRCRCSGSRPARSAVRMAAAASRLSCLPTTEGRTDFAASSSTSRAATTTRKRDLSRAGRCRGPSSLPIRPTKRRTPTT